MKHVINTIAKLQLDEKTYTILRIDDDKIFFAVSEHGINRIELTEEEKDLFGHFYNSLKVHPKTSLNLGTKRINGKNITIFFDYTANLHYWYEIIDGIRHEADEEISKYFNFKYNHIVECVASELSNNKSSSISITQEYINRFIKIGKQKIAILIAAGISAGSLVGCRLSQEINADSRPSEYIHEIPKTTNPSSDYSETTITSTTAPIIKFENPYLSDIIKQRSEQEYDWEIIKEAITSNSGLEDTTKQILLNLKFVFDENYQYMDLPAIIDKLNNLKVEFVDNATSLLKDSGSEFVGDVGGFYSYSTNTIAYDKKQANNLSVRIHELMHVLQVRDINCGNSYNFSSELSNEILTREIVLRLQDLGLIEELGFSNFSTSGKYWYTSCAAVYGGAGYEDNLPVERILFECLSQEQLKQYQFMASNDILVTALMNLEEPTSDQKTFDEQLARAYKLLDTFEDTRVEETMFNPRFKELEHEIKEALSYYYEKKYNKSVTDTIMPGILYNSRESEAFLELLSEEVPDWNEKWSNGRYWGIFNRTYFSNYVPYPVIYYTNPDTNEPSNILIVDDRIEDIYEKKKQKESKVDDISNNIQEISNDEER